MYSMQEHVALLYPELRALAARYLSGARTESSLRPTVLVQEAFGRLRGQEGAPWKNKAQFMAVAATTMRRILVDYARARTEREDGQGRMTIETELESESSFQADLLELDDALEALGELSDRRARLVEMRFFAGMIMSDIASELSISVRTAGDDWAFARNFLNDELKSEAAKLLVKRSKPRASKK